MVRILPSINVLCFRIPSIAVSTTSSVLWRALRAPLSHRENWNSKHTSQWNFLTEVQTSPLLYPYQIRVITSRYRTAQRRDKRVPPPDPHGILQMRAQLPLEPEFVDIFRKFKLSFNLLVRFNQNTNSEAKLFSDSSSNSYIILKKKSVLIGLSFSGKTAQSHSRAECSRIGALSVHSTLSGARCVPLGTRKEHCHSGQSSIYDHIYH